MLQAVEGIKLGEGIGARALRRGALPPPLRCAVPGADLTSRPAGTTVAAPRQLVVHGDARSVAAAVEQAELEFPLRACPLSAPPRAPC